MTGFSNRAQFQPKFSNPVTITKAKFSLIHNAKASNKGLKGFKSINKA